jgi:hypothetical protein
MKLCYDVVSSHHNRLNLSHNCTYHTSAHANPNCWTDAQPAQHMRGYASYPPAQSGLSRRTVPVSTPPNCTTVAKKGRKCDLNTHNPTRHAPKSTCEQVVTQTQAHDMVYTILQCITVRPTSARPERKRLDRKRPEQSNSQPPPPSRVLPSQPKGGFTLGTTIGESFRSF